MVMEKCFSHDDSQTTPVIEYGRGSSMTGRGHRYDRFITPRTASGIGLFQGGAGLIGEVSYESEFETGGCYTA